VHGAQGFLGLMLFGRMHVARHHLNTRVFPTGSPFKPLKDRAKYKLFQPLRPYYIIGGRGD